MEELLPIFCNVDDFGIEYERYCKTHLLIENEEIIPKKPFIHFDSKLLACMH